MRKKKTLYRDSLKRLFTRCLIGVSITKKLTFGLFGLILVLCGIKFHYYGSEFLPKLNEGAIYIRATLPSSINLDESVRLTKEMKGILRNFEEVKFVLTQTGRPNDGTDPTGFFNIEFHTQLKPENEWKRSISKDALLEEMRIS